MWLYSLTFPPIVYEGSFLQFLASICCLWSPWLLLWLEMKSQCCTDLHCPNWFQFIVLHVCTSFAGDWSFPHNPWIVFLCTLWYSSDLLWSLVY
jgi:hypothetical protein